MVAEQFSLAERQAYRRRLLAWCRRAATARPEEIPGYVLSYYAAHLRDAGDYEALYRLIGRDWMDAKAAQTHSHWAFVQDVLLMIEAAGGEEPPNLVEMLRGLLIHATLISMASSVPPQALGVLAQGGRELAPRVMPR